MSGDNLELVALVLLLVGAVAVSAAAFLVSQVLGLVVAGCIALVAGVAGLVWAHRAVS